MGISYFTIDRHKIGYLLARTGSAGVFGKAARDISGLVTETETPYPEGIFATSVLVTGTDEAGNDFEVITGATGDSGKRVEIDTTIINSKELATGVGSAYSGALSRKTRGLEVTVVDTEAHRVMDLVKFEGVRYRVVEVSSAADEHEQNLRLIEV